MKNEKEIDAKLSFRLERIKESLSNVYYRNNPLPPEPGAEQIKAIRRIIRTAKPGDLKKLKKWTGLDETLIYYAQLDTDKDGVKDFRVCEFSGKFYEGDIDVDGDGIRNLYDPEPWNKDTNLNDSNGDGIPDITTKGKAVNQLPKHLDWSLKGKSKKLIRIQWDLFQKYKIILVERSAQFNEDLAESISDVLDVLFAPYFTKHEYMKSLRTIATEEFVYLGAEDDDGTNAMVVSQSQSLILFHHGIKASSFVQFGLIAHEIAHAYQYDLDWTGDLITEGKRFSYPAPKFRKLMEGFGWKSERLAGENKTATQDRDPLFVKMYEEIELFDEKYLGQSATQWKDVIKNKITKLGATRSKVRVFKDKHLKRDHVLGAYSLVNSWEWYSDHLIAYTYLEMEAASSRLLAGLMKPQEVRNATLAVVARAWPRWYYPNHEGSKIQQYFKKNWPLTTFQSETLAKRYLIPYIFDDEVSSSVRNRDGYSRERAR